jgi:hypothetical protein
VVWKIGVRARATVQAGGCASGQIRSGKALREALPELRDKLGSAARRAFVQCEHAVVVAACFIDVRQAGKQECEVHDIAPGVERQALDTTRSRESERTGGRAHDAQAANVYRLSLFRDDGLIGMGKG